MQIYAHLEWHEGFLCAVHSSEMFLEPVAVWNYFPLRSCTKEEAKQYQIGAKMVLEGESYRDIQTGHYFPLLNGGKTVSIHCEQIPLKKPRGMKRWSYGEWVK